MPVTYAGYPAPITTAQLGPGPGTGPSQDEFNKWQSIGSPMGPGGFPAYNAIYNVYGNSGAAALRNAQIGNGGSSVNPATSAIPGFTPTGGTGGTTPPAGYTAAPSGGGFIPTGSNSSMFSGSVPGLTPTGGGSTSGVGGFASGAPPNLESLTGLVNKLNLQGQQAANAGRVPGSAGLEAQSSANIGNELQGNLPPDVVRQITQQAAERGIATGSPGSDNSNSSLLRSLGLNSLQLQQQGQQNLSAADARNPGARVFDPSSQLLTPAQAAELNNQNAQLQLAWYKALNPGAGGGGNRGGGQSPTTQADPTQQNWFKNLMGGTPSTPGAPPSMSQGVTQDPNYPGTSIPGLPNLSGIIGTQDPGYGLSPDPFGQGSQFDASNPSAWDFTGGDGFDPFTQY